MQRSRALSLIEVIIAVVVLGLVAALTIPRLGQAAPPPDARTELRAELKVLRVAIDLYHRDHDAFPGQCSDGTNPAGSVEALVTQLTQFSDAAGNVSGQRDATFCFGPYLRDGLPTCAVVDGAAQRGVLMVCGTARPMFSADALGAAWVYNYETGQIVANTDALDEDGRPYASY